MRDTITRKSMNVFIYRPDRAPHSAIRPELCYTFSDKNYITWQQEQAELKRFKLEKAKEFQIPEHKVLDYWR